MLLILKKWKPVPFLGNYPLFYSGVLALLIVGIIGVFGIIDFDKLFNAFHKVVFPGKTNWLFDPRYDEVILILPEKFFMNCAILMGSGLLTLSITSIVYSVIKKNKLYKLAVA